jgi:hypothetical protein
LLHFELFVIIAHSAPAVADTQRTRPPPRPELGREVRLVLVKGRTGLFAMGSRGNGTEGDGVILKVRVFYFWMAWSR